MIVKTQLDIVFVCLDFSQFTNLKLSLVAPKAQCAIQPTKLAQLRLLV